MPGMNRTGPESEGPKTGRGLGRCKKIASQDTNEILGTGMGLRRNSGGGLGKGKRLKSDLGSLKK